MQTCPLNRGKVKQLLHQLLRHPEVHPLARLDARQLTELMTLLAKNGHLNHSATVSQPDLRSHSPMAGYGADYVGGADGSRVRSVASRHCWEPRNPAGEHLRQRYAIELPEAAQAHTLRLLKGRHAMHPHPEEKCVRSWVGACRQSGADAFA